MSQAPLGRAEELSQALIFPNVFEFNRRFLTPEARSAPLFQLYSQLPFALAGVSAVQTDVVTHEMPSPDVLAHWRDRLSFTPDFICCPPVTACLSVDVIKSSDCMNTIKDRLSNRGTLFRPWGQTIYLENLLDALGGLGETWQRNCSPLVNLLDAKAGNRALIDQILLRVACQLRALPVMIVPSDSQSLIAAITAMLSEWTHIVVKPGATWGGKGTSLISRADFRDSQSTEFRSMADSYANGFYAIEPFVGDESGSLSPSFDWMPLGNGHGKCIVGRMLMDGFRCGGTMYGLGAVPIPASQISDMRRFVECSATVLSELGYHGWFDTDFLVAGPNALVSELNIRHTGGTVPIEIAQALFQEDWETTTCCVAIDGVRTSRSPTEIMRKAVHLGYNKGQARDAFVVTAYRAFPEATLTSVWLSSGDPEKAMSDTAKLQTWLA